MIKNINTYYQDNSAQKLVGNYDDYVQFQWSNAIFQLPQIRKGVLIGDIRDMRSLFLMVLAKSIIVVDDGMASLSLHKDHSDFEWVRYWFKRLILKWVWNCRFKEITVRSTLISGGIPSLRKLKKVTVF